MARSYAIQLMMMLGAALPLYGQGQVDKHGTYIPTAEEIEANRGVREVLRNPTVIKLRLVSIPPQPDQPSNSPLTYKLGDYLAFQLIVSHAFSEPIVIWQAVDPYRDVRPELFKDGTLLPYRKTAQDNVDRAEKEPPSGSGAPRCFLPGNEYDSVRIDLEQWYGALQTGHYQLSVRRRFAWDGEWVESSSIAFNIR